MTDITEEMQSIIAKNLPSATAGAMTDFIAEAGETKKRLEISAKEVDELEIELDLSKKEVSALSRQLEDQSSLAIREEKLMCRTEALDIRERDLQLELVQNDLASANERNITVERLVDKVFGHPAVTVSTHKDVVVPATGGNNACGYAHKEMGVNEIETTTSGKM